MIFNSVLILSSISWAMCNFSFVFFVLHLVLWFPSMMDVFFAKYLQYPLYWMYRLRFRKIFVEFSLDLFCYVPQLENLEDHASLGCMIGC